MTCVFVVDDDQSIRAVIRLALEEEGYVVTEAADGRDVVQVLEHSDKRCVVLLDLQMPGVDGVQVLNTLALHPELSERHVIVIMSANAHLLEAVSPVARDQFIAQVLNKPFHVMQLLDALESAKARIRA